MRFQNFIDINFSGLMDGVRLDVFFPGFPTLKHIPHTAKLKASGVRVFEQVSNHCTAERTLYDSLNNSGLPWREHDSSIEGSRPTKREGRRTRTPRPGDLGLVAAHD